MRPKMEPRRAGGKGRAFCSCGGRPLWHPPAMRFAFPLLALGLAMGTAYACTTPASGTGGAGAGGAPPPLNLTGGSDPTGALCATCLRHECAAERAACTADCYAIQACLDTVCFNLSVIGSTDEGTCQVHCQALHPEGLMAHLAYVDCAYAQPQVIDAGTDDAGPIDAGSVTCIPPCLGYPYDYDLCVAAENAGGCKAALEACEASSDCKAYFACASTCTTYADCEACAAGTAGDAGESLYEAYQLCLDQVCFAQGWLPHF